MPAEELTCLVFILAVALLVVFIVFLLKRGSARVRRRQADVTYQLIQSIDRLVANPHDRETLEQIVGATSTTSWVPEVPWEPAKELWNRSISFAFDHLDLPSGQAVAFRILAPLAASPAFEASKFMSAVRQVVADKPADRGIHGVVLSCLRAMPLDQNQRQWLYERVLDLVQQSPSSSDLSVLALEVGRWHFGKSRNGAVTVYDESAIQNDIAVRRGTA